MTDTPTPKRKRSASKFVAIPLASLPLGGNMLISASTLTGLTNALAKCEDAEGDYMLVCVRDTVSIKVQTERVITKARKAKPAAQPDVQPPQ